MTLHGKLAASLYLCYGACCLGGCSGRIVDLDHPAPGSDSRSGSAFAPGSGSASTSTPTSGGGTSSAPSQLPLGEVGGVWVDDQRLYWSTYGTLDHPAPTNGAAYSKSYHSCLKFDCEHTTVTYEFDGGDNLVLDEQRVYWTRCAQIVSCPIEGCTGPSMMITEDPALFGFSIAAKGGYVYWSSDLDLLRCPASGCAGPPSVFAKATVTRLVVFDGARVYWQANKGIFSGPSDGSSPPELVTARSTAGSLKGIVNESETEGLAIGGGYLYWATARQVFRCPAANCSASEPTVLATATDDIHNLKIDDVAMYWMEANTIRSCPLSGCQQSRALTPQQVTPLNGQDEGARYAVDASDLYWIESTDAPRAPMTGVLRKTAK